MTGGVVGISTDGYSGSPFIYNVTIDQTLIADDTTFVSFDTSDPLTGNSLGSIKFCTRVSTIEGPIQVAFRETIFDLQFDLTDNCIASSCFSVTGIVISENNPDSFETLIEDDFGVDICQCSNYVCYGAPQNPGSPAPIQQNTPLVLCLLPTGGLPSVVHISNFNLQLSAGTVTYEPVQFGSATWEEDVLTVVTVDASGDIVMITTPVVAQFYIQAHTSIQASGNCFLEFDSGKVDALPVFANYGLDIELAAETQVGCLQGLVQKLTGMFKSFKDGIPNPLEGIEIQGNLAGAATTIQEAAEGVATGAVDAAAGAAEDIQGAVQNIQEFLP